MGESARYTINTDPTTDDPCNSFYCQGRTLLLYTISTVTSAILGSIMPFRRWFNERKYKVRWNDRLKGCSS